MPLQGTNDVVEATTVQRMLAACSGSLINSLVATPFDVIRVRLQLQECVPPPLDNKLKNPLKSYGLPKIAPQSVAAADIGVTACCRDVFTMPSSVDYCVASQFDECAVHQYSQRQIFRGTWDGLHKITANEGINALWRGLSPTLVMTIPSNVIYFVGYDYLRAKIPIQSDTLAPLLSGGLARTLSTAAVSPLELFRTRLQSVSTEVGSRLPRQAFMMTWDGVKVMIRTHGWLSLWRGLTLTLWRDVPFSAVYWTGYEKTKQVLSHYNRGRSNITEAETFAQAFFAGAASGSFAAFVTTPFDVGKTRRQVLKNRDPKMDSMLQMLRQIHADEGLPGLFRGLGPRVLKVSVSCAIMISFYEVGKRISTRTNGRHGLKPDDEVFAAVEAE
ncbi:mitochondrial carrier domain-containing protein [Lipomyces japonicus]|uniref:mitochondrial carrier domain-containing protein n=1 Tax=Lipomyces japonicus TaxID=56871 RepID=UPI0034CE9555